MSQPTFKTKHYLATLYEDGLIVQQVGEADCTPRQAARELRQIADWLELLVDAKNLSRGG